MQAGSPVRRSQKGFTYVVLLAGVAILSIGLAIVGPQWADDADRERERELIRVGGLYANAIESYYRASPGSVAQFPPTLDALLEDRRLVGTYRHLRRLYPDPMAPAEPWGLVRAEDGGIRGVFSRSRKVPLRIEPLDLGSVHLPASRSYDEWIFAPNVRRH